jgi:hypothetical protein
MAATAHSIFDNLPLAAIADELGDLDRHAKAIQARMATMNAAQTVAAPALDLNLLTLARQQQAAHAAYLIAAEADEDTAAAHVASQELVQRVAAMPALSRAGMLAKLETLARWRCMSVADLERDHGDQFNDEPDRRLLASILGDIRRRVRPA